MTSFSPYLLGKKLALLNQSQESIETLSLWILHHHNHASTIVKQWASEFMTVSENQKISFLFLANEIIKASKKKYHIFREEFKEVLPDILEYIGKNFIKCNLIDQTQRILNIWRSNAIFSEKTIEGFWTCLNDGSLAAAIERECDELEAEEPYDMKKMFLIFKAPTSEELIKALESLHGFSTTDNYARKEIDAFPKKLFETKTMYALKNTKEGAEYAEKLAKAQKLVESYNEMLELELKQRKKLKDMLLGYKEAELERIADIEKKLEDIENDLQEKINLRMELERHRNSLPDLEHFSNATELPPLPSAQDLFRKQEAI